MRPELIVFLFLVVSIQWIESEDSDGENTQAIAGTAVLGRPIKDTFVAVDSQVRTYCRWEETNLNLIDNIVYAHNSYCWQDLHSNLKRHKVVRKLEKSVRSSHFNQAGCLPLLICL